MSAQQGRPSAPKQDGHPEVMYLVRSRTGGHSWAEWDDIWPDLIHKVTERAEEQKGTHPGFDVVEVFIQRHAVVRPTVIVEEGAAVGWRDAPPPPDSDQQKVVADLGGNGAPSTYERSDTTSASVGAS